MEWQQSSTTAETLDWNLEWAASLAKYDWTEAMANDYDDGLSLSNLAGKYGISASHARKIVLTKRRRLRTTSEAMAINASTERWHKLSKMRGSATRLISMPGAVLRQLSVNSEAKLQGRWTAAPHHRLRLEVAVRSRGRRKEGWHKLTPSSSGRGRIISIPSKDLRSLGIDRPNRELSGRWRVNQGSLFLEIEYSKRVRGMKIVRRKRRRLWKIIQWLLKGR